MSAFHRYVALGDSQTEGLNDGNDATGFRGWADRLAEHLAATTSPDLGYANLAVRGCRTRHVVEEQLPVALSLEPDLATVAVGMNDLLRHDFDLDDILAGIEETLAALTATGCHVVTMTFPDIARMLPVMRWLRPKEERLAAGILAASAKYDVPVLDLFPLPVCGDPRLWSRDRIHGSPYGHAAIAAGVAELMGLPGSDNTWSVPLPDPPGYGRLAVVRRDAWWAATFVVPFLTRQLLGRGPMSNHHAKRPVLLPVEQPTFRADWMPPASGKSG